MAISLRAEIAVLYGSKSVCLLTALALRHVCNAGILCEILNLLSSELGSSATKTKNTKKWLTIVIYSGIWLFNSRKYVQIEIPCDFKIFGRIIFKNTRKTIWVRVSHCHIQMSQHYHDSWELLELTLKRHQTLYCQKFEGYEWNFSTKCK